MTIVWAILIFSFLIFVHELGHFMTAKFFGVRVLEFAIGMGPALFKTQRGETVYALRVFPIGGFCKMEGEDDASEDPEAFCRQGKLVRFLILVMGSVMNIIAGLLILCVINVSLPSLPSTTIERVLENSAAYEVGIESGDRIVSMDGQGVNIYQDIRLIVLQSKDRPISIKVERHGEIIEKTITPKFEAGVGGFMIGVSPAISPKNLGTIAKETAYGTVWVVKLVFVSLKELIVGNVPVTEVQGPVGIVSAIGQSAKRGVLDVLNLAALIAINLGVMNLLPLPALDGGRIFFLLIEFVIRRPVKAEYEAVVHLVGLCLLLIFMLFITYQDIIRLIGVGA